MDQPRKGKKVKKIVMFALMFALVLTSNVAMASDTELIGGGGMWWNNLCKGDFAYAEGMFWMNGEYSPGFGAYGMLENGESKLTAYEWSGHEVGPQVGYKHYWVSDSGKFGEDNRGIGYARQWQIKIRYVWESLDGKNSESGYRMTQDDTKLGLYGEYVSQLSERWQGIAIAEGWKTMTMEKSSSWAGDKAENRDQYSAGIFGQYKFSDPLSIRAGASLFYQGWDEMSGVRVQGEVRLYSHFMAGVYVSSPFAVPEVDKQYNAEVADLVTTGLYGRIEF
jgi:hypothetical protein